MQFAIHLLIFSGREWNVKVGRWMMCLRRSWPHSPGLCESVTCTWPRAMCVSAILFYAERDGACGTGRKFTVDVFRAIRIGFELSLEFSHIHVGSVTVCIRNFS